MSADNSRFLLGEGGEGGAGKIGGTEKAKVGWSSPCHSFDTYCWLWLVGHLSVLIVSCCSQLLFFPEGRRRRRPDHGGGSNAPSLFGIALVYTCHSPCVGMPPPPPSCCMACKRSCFLLPGVFRLAEYCFHVVFFFWDVFDRFVFHVHSVEYA